MVSYLPIRREKIDRIRQATKEDEVMSVLIETILFGCRGVARGKCMWKQGRRSGQDRFVTQLKFVQLGVWGGGCKPPSGARGRSPEANAFLATIY